MATNMTVQSILEETPLSSHQANYIVNLYNELSDLRFFFGAYSPRQVSEGKLYAKLNRLFAAAGTIHNRVIGNLPEEKLSGEWFDGEPEVMIDYAMGWLIEVVTFAADNRFNVSFLYYLLNLAAARRREFELLDLSPEAVASMHDQESIQRAIIIARRHNSLRKAS